MNYIEEMGKKAKEASKKLLTLDTETKNRALTMIAEELINKKEEIQIVLKRIPEKWILHQYRKRG